MTVQRNYKIGDFVIVSRTVDFGYEDDKRIVIQTVQDKPFVAQITGATYRQLGVIETGGEDWEGCTTFKCTSTFLVWKVRRGVTNKEIDVIESGIQRMRQTDPHGYPTLPWQHRSCNG